MYRRKFIAAVMLLICLVISTQLSYGAKSVFVISSQDYSIVKPYLIDANHVTLQATSVLPQEGGGAIALAAWPQKELLFATYDFSSVIAWVSTRNLVYPGEYTEPNANSFGGIVVDTGKGKIYVAERETQYLYVYKWNDANKTLEPNGVHDLSAQTYNLFGLALDEPNGRLYVTDNTNTIRCYDTNTWQYDSNNSLTIPRAAVGIAVDPNRGYLYTGQFTDASGDHTYLVRTRLSDHNSIDINLGGGNSVIGIDVDRDSGLVYCTTTNNDFRVYDCNLILQDISENVSYPYDLGPAGVAVGGYYFTQDFNITKTDNVSSCVSPNDTINYNICYDANGFADSNVVIVDQLPAEINFVSASGGVSTSYDANSRTVTWNLGTLLTSNATGCVQLTVTVNPQAQQVCYIANTCEMLGDTFSGCATEKTYICGKHPVVYVDVNKPAGGNGQSWVTAYKELRDALTNVRDGNCGCAEQIWVVKGTYKPCYDKILC